MALACLILICTIFQTVSLPHKLLAADKLQRSAQDKAAIKAAMGVLQKHCWRCHSHDTGKAEGGLMLDSMSGWFTGGDSGPAVIAGKPEASRLVQAVEYRHPSLKMPPQSRLPATAIKKLRRWIELGAGGGRLSSTVAGSSERPPADQPHPKSEPARIGPLWSMQRLRVPRPPRTETSGIGREVRNTIDQFVIAARHSAGLQSVPAADLATLARRASFDLTGLPPTPEELLRLRDDKSAGAYERMIDRLLASPRYGEHWGRRWLDLARYADSNGGDINYAHAHAWRYRDYVVDSWNRDKAYDQFVVEQLAGDLLPSPLGERQRNEQLTATGFLMLGPKMLAEVDTDKLQLDIADEQLSVSSRTFLGLTIGCARCHDHKFDPISTRDYYALAGIFTSTKTLDVLRPANGVSQWLERELTTEQTARAIRQHQQQRTALQSQIEQLGGPLVDASNTAAAPRAVVSKVLNTIRSTTWLAWVRLHKHPNLDAVVSAPHSGADQGHSLGFHNGPTARHPRVVWNHGSGHTIIVAAKPLPLEQWQHLAVTYNAASRRLQLYVNGIRAASANNVPSTPFTTISVGRREASRQWPFHGVIDDVRVYNKALDESAILRAAGEAPTTAPTYEPGLVLHWDFSQPAVTDPTAQVDDRTRVVDVSPNKNYGRLVGFPARASQAVYRTGRDGRHRSAISIAPRGSPNRSPQQESRVRQLTSQLARLQQTKPYHARAMAVIADAPRDIPVHIRGNHLQTAALSVPRGVPQVFHKVLAPAKIASTDNGRLELARWITDPAHPLTARVMANRIWQGHFGAGLVSTPSNFGHRGSPPSHPELLDWLARELIHSGWSVKHLHRLIMTSSTYRLSSAHHVKNAALDPANRLLWRFTPRRLEAESIRDALLHVGGNLNLEAGGNLLASPNYQRVKLSPQAEVHNTPRRTIYLPVIRVRGFQMAAVFDVPNSGRHVGRRPETTVAQQALFMLNNPLPRRQAARLADALLQSNRQSNSGLPDVREETRRRIELLCLRLYSRQARASEYAALSELVLRLSERTDMTEHQVWTHVAHVMLCANDFVFVF